jgi:predicted nucleotidyltransferase
MEQKLQVAIPQEQVVEFCRRWAITELSVFGSVLRGDFRAESDEDILVSAHEYDEVREKRIGAVTTQHVPELARALAAILPPVP